MRIEPLDFMSEHLPLLEDPLYSYRYEVTHHEGEPVLRISLCAGDSPIVVSTLPVDVLPLYREWHEEGLEPRGLYKVKDLRGNIESLSGQKLIDILVEGLEEMSNAVTNTIDCQQQLTLIKAVGPQPPVGISPDDWKLSATPAGGEAAAVAGATGIVGSVSAGTAYDLSETAGFIGGTEFLASEWSCELASGSGTLYQEGTVVVPSYGQSIVCSIVSSWEAPALNVTKSAREPVKVVARRVIASRSRRMVRAVRAVPAASVRVGSVLWLRRLQIINKEQHRL